MKNMLHKQATLLAALALAFVALAAFPQTGRADTFALEGTGTLGSFSGIFQYIPAGPTAGSVKISLTNDSPLANGGYITGFAFNFPSVAVVSGVTFSSDYPDFALLGVSPLNNVNASPYGKFDVGSTTGVSWSGGNTHGAIAVGDTGTFQFDLTGTGLGSLGAGDFLEALSYQTNDKLGEAFIVRFQGFCDGGSDKVPGIPSPTPEPATLALLGLGVAGLVLRRRAL